MRIGITINKSWNIYNFRKGLILAFLKAGHHVIAIAPEDSYSGKLKEWGCQYQPISIDNKGVDPIKDIVFFFSLVRIYKRVNLDIILHFTIKPNIYGSVASFLLRTPCISNISGLGTIFMRNNISSYIGKLLYKVALRFPDIVFFQNKDDRNLFLSKKLISKKNTDLLPGSGIDIKHFSPYPYIGKNKVFTFLMISRILYDKGILELIEAIRILRKKNISFQCKLLGTIESERKLGATAKDVEDWQREKLIMYIGTSDDVRNEICHADCIVLPSYREGTSRFLLEAAAMGKPIITTNVPGCREIVRNKFNGLLCNVRDAQDLAEKMLYMQQMNPKLLNKFGKNSRELAVTVFDEKIVIKKYVLAINRIASKRKLLINT